MKSELQMRAEKAAERFRTGARSPLVIEFAGVPKAGKTTTLTQLQAFLRRCGFRVDVVVERASVCPIRDKKHANFNVWTACTSLAQILEKTQTPPRPDDPDILILDRGIFDAICWLALMERLARIRSQDRSLIERFLLVDDWRKRISGVIVMTAEPKDALLREQGLLPVTGARGSIMNHEVLQQTRQLVQETSDRLKTQFRILEVDTSSVRYNKPEKACAAVADQILNWIEEQLQEDILSIPKKVALDAFEDRKWLPPAESKSIIEAFLDGGEYKPRAEVEADEDRVQALPVVVVRNQSGDILRLRRREQDAKNSLHQKVVIWAGGHVRKEDAQEGNSILRCAVRELQEELRLNVDADALRLLGAVYVNHGPRTSKHVALVYEWKAATDDVSVALSTAEFFERRGASLSGSFVNTDVLAEDIEKGRISEDWSQQIVRNLLSVSRPRLNLFD